MLGVVTVLMAVLGGIVSVLAPDRAWQKVSYAAAFLVLGVVSILLVVRQVRESALTNARLESSLRELSKSSSIISSLSRENLDTQTGGDSFAIMEIDRSLTPIDPRRLVVDALPAYTVHLKGKYPLHRLQAQTAIANGQCKQIEGQIGEDLDIGELLPDVSWDVGPDELHFEQDNRAAVDICFEALNGSWTEQLRLRKMGGIWLQAIRVLRRGPGDQDERVVYEKLDEHYPQPRGKMKW
jgi:hypothetical protein